MKIFRPRSRGQNSTLWDTPSKTNPRSGAARRAILAASLLAAASLALPGSHAQGRITLSPTYVSFGEVALNTTRTVTVAVTNTGNAPVVFNGESLTAASQFTMSGFTMPISLAAGKSVTFALEFSPTVVGVKSGTMTLLSNAANKRLMMWMNGTGVRLAVTATPAGASFGSVAIGVSNSQTIQLKNTGTAGATISSTSASGNGVSISGMTLPAAVAAGKTATFNVAFAPIAPGAVAGSVSIHGNFPTVTLPVSGTGVSAANTIVASTRSENFGKVTVGSRATAAVDLKNTGAKSITISGLSYSGMGVTASGGVNVVLNPGQSTPITVKFAPAQAGSFTGSVVVDSTASDSALAITVSGTGVAAAAHSVSLKWAASSSSGVSGYDVYRSTTSGGPYTKLDSTPVAALDYIDLTVQSGTEYFYVVTSIASDGAQSRYSNQISVSIP
jgi:hypothetical protein